MILGYKQILHLQKTTTIQSSHLIMPAKAPPNTRTTPIAHPMSDNHPKLLPHMIQIIHRLLREAHKVVKVPTKCSIAKEGI